MIGGTEVQAVVSGEAVGVSFSQADFYIFVIARPGYVLFYQIGIWFSTGIGSVKGKFKLFPGIHIYPVKLVAMVVRSREKFPLIDIRKRYINSCQ